MNKIYNYNSFNDFLIQIKKENDESIENKFITICDIDYKIFNSITNVIKSQKCKYKKDYCTEYKLINVFQIRNTLNNWKDLYKSIFYNSKPCIKYHYKSDSFSI